MIEVFAVLGCYATSTGRMLTEVLGGNLSVPSTYCTAGSSKMGSVVSFERTVTNDQPTPHDIPEEQTPQVHCSGSLQTLKFGIIRVDFLAQLEGCMLFHYVT